MADSDFWRNLANEFRALASQSGVNAFLRGKRGAGGAWILTGNYSYRQQFGALASRAARELEPDNANLIDVWISALSDEMPDSLHTPNPDTLSNLCPASADFCNALEIRAIEAEAVMAIEEKQRNDPRQWPPLLQELSAFESFKDLNSRPAKEIPEAVVRSLISQRTGIKPEDVTFNQIRSEIAQLFAYYGPKITLTAPEASLVNEFDMSPEVARTESSAEPTWAQLERLRDAAHIDVEGLADRLDIAARSVYRHLSGEAMPNPKQRAAYQRVFSELLETKVVITKVSGKRQ